MALFLSNKRVLALGNLNQPEGRDFTAYTGKWAS
jgi:hypothetical protein